MYYPYITRATEFEMKFNFSEILEGGGNKASGPRWDVKKLHVARTYVYDSIVFGRGGGVSPRTRIARTRGNAT